MLNHNQVLLLTKAGDVETNPGPTTLNKKVWICDICHKQINIRKPISIRCNRIEHWVRLRCAGTHQAQYTDTWTCHLHRESRLTPHTDSQHKVLHRPSSKSERNLIILQVNINGLRNKLEELKLLIHDTHADIITIQETKLSPKIHNFTAVHTRQEVGSLHSLEATSHYYNRHTINYLYTPHRTSNGQCIH